MSDLNSTRLRELLYYDASTGVFTRRVTTSPKAQAGTVAGGLDGKRHWVIRVDSRRYQAHRLAWLYVYGKWPDGDVDHINGDGADNRIANLRDVSHATNMQNQRQARRTNTSRYLGVTKKRNKWQAYITAAGKPQYLGVFDTPEEAHAAYVEAKRQQHAGCTI